MADSIIASLIGSLSPFELESLPDETRVFKHAPKTLKELYRRALGRSGNSLVVIDGDRRITVGALFSAANNLGTALATHLPSSFGPPRIALLLPSGIAWTVAFVAITNLEASAVLIPYDLNVPAIIQQLLDTKCSLLLTDLDFAQAIAADCPFGVIVVSDDGHEIGFKAKKESGTGADHFAPRPAPGPTAEAFVAFTSGSTGVRKGVVLTHQGVVTGLWNMMLGGVWSARRNPPQPRHASIHRTTNPACALVLTPMTHVGGYSQLLLMLAVTGRIVIMTKWDVDRAVSLIQTEGVKTLAGATPTQIREILRSDAAVEGQLSLEHFSIHGAALRRGLIQEIRKVFPRAGIGTGYGMTETNGSIAVASATEVIANPSICGPVLPTVDIRIVGDSGVVASSNPVGEIWVRGCMLFAGYCSAASNVGSMDASGWFATGDVGAIDGDGVLSVFERSRDVLRLPLGEIRCSDIEQQLDDWRCGDDAAVVSVNDCHSVLILVIPRRDEDFVTDNIKERIELTFNIPAQRVTVLSCANFPRTPSGKLDRRAAAALAGFVS